MGIDAIGASTVGDDFAAAGQRPSDLVEHRERRGLRTRDVPRAKLRLGAHVENDHASSSESVDELGGGDLLDLAVPPEVRVRKDGHVRDVARGDVSNGGPELGHALAREPVVHPSAVAARTRQAARREQPQMMRRGSHGLARLSGDVLDGPLALGEQVDDFRAPSAGKSLRDGRERVEELGLRVTGHILKLSFEYMTVNRATPAGATAVVCELWHSRRSYPLE